MLQEGKGLYESKQVKNHYDNLTWRTGILTIFLDPKVPWRKLCLTGLSGGIKRRKGYGNGGSCLAVAQPRGVAERSRDTGILTAAAGWEWRCG